MARAPFQVLVFLYRQDPQGSIEYGIFRRQDHDYWQGIAGGGEDVETPLEAAYRETAEEAGLRPREVVLNQLMALAMIPAVQFGGLLWGPSVPVIPEYAFGAKCADQADVTISPEHAEFRWASYETAASLLRWDSNRTALWELNYRLSAADL